MKYSRGKNKKNRLVVIGICIVLIVIISLVFILFNEKGSLSGDSMKEYGSDAAVKREENSMTLPTPTLEPVKSEDSEDKEIGHQEEVYLYKYDATLLQTELLSMVGNEDYKYGDAYRNSVLTHGGFVASFYDELGKKIEVEEVGIGDVGIGAGFTGICVGFDNGVPVFAYAADKTMYSLSYSGVCLGYVRNIADMTFCGMFPVDFVEFYDCCGTGGDSGLLHEKKGILIDNMVWYADAVYDCGRAFSQKNVSGLIELMPKRVLHQHNVKVLPEEFLKFLTGFAKQQGCPGEDYSFYVIEEEHSGDEFSALKVACLSLEQDTYMQAYGAWDVTMYQTFEFLPCRAYVSSYIGEYGFVPANNVSVKEDDEGNVVVEKEEIVYGLTEDENGRPIYRAYDGSVMYLDTREPSGR